MRVEGHRRSSKVVRLEDTSIRNRRCEELFASEACSGVPEAHLLTRAQLRHGIERPRRDDSRSPGSRPSPGGRRAGSSAARRRRPASNPARSPRSASSPVRRRSSAGPTSRAPIRSACSESRHDDSNSAAPRGIREPVGSRAGSEREGHRTGRRRERDVLVDDGHGCRGLGADLEHLARDDRLGAERGERVTRPGSEHGGHLEAAAHGRARSGCRERPCRAPAPRRSGPAPPCRAAPVARRARRGPTRR